MQLLPLNPPALLQFLFSFLLLASSVLFVLRAAASRYFAVDDDAAFEPENRGYGEFRRGGQPMSIGGRGDGNSQSGSSSGSGKCASCGKSGSKVCSRCKNVRYCSESCQSKHWRKNHKYVCRKKEFSSENALMSGHGEFKVLFPYDEFVRLYNWNKHVFPPCGLSNCGNSCFANVVLQCLACTRPLVAYLLEGTHSRQCRRNSWCVLCELQLHIERVTRNVQPFSPLNILTQLPNISSNLGYGRQEDAHEFMRYAIDTMQSVCLDEHGGEKALASSTQETTLIQHVFGGHLQSQVICTNCNMTSNRYENMMDLTVEIQGDAESLEECLDQFTVKEWLDGENKYKCDGCDDYVKAWKRLTVHQAPNILTIALKRFQSGRFGKLNKRVTFPETLELSPYMSNAGDKSNIYKLFAVVVHLDMLNASFFGHYICYTRDFGGNWYMIDDCKVIKVELEEVLSQGAYMLLYSRLNAREHKPLEIIKENVLLTNPLEVAVSDISKSFCSSDAAFQNGTPIKCNGIINIETRDVNVIGSASVEHDEQRFTSSDKYSSSSADSMDVDANGSHDCSLEENRSTDMPNGSLTVQQLTYSGNSAIHEAPTEQIPTSTERILSSKTDSMDVDANGSHDCALEENRSTDMSNGSLTVQQLTYSGNSKIHEAPTEQIPTSTERILSSKTDTVQTVVSNIFREADSLEQNVSLDMPGIQAKGSLYNGETTNAKAQVTSVSSSFLSLSKSGLAESDGFPESSLNQKAKVSAVASKSNTIFRTGSKTLFARGFLDKPLKKKSVSQSKDQLGDISFSQSTKKEARELPESSCAVSCEESNSLVWSDPAQKKAVDLNRFENGRAENRSNCPSMNNRSNRYSEPRPSHQISPQYPVHGNGKISSVAFDPRACLSNPSPVVNGTSMVIDGDDLTVEMSQTNPREQLLSVSEDLENGSSISGEISKDLPDISDPSLNEVPALCQKRSADGKCNTVEDDLSGKANGSSYQTSGVAQ